MASWDLEPLPTYRPRRPIRAGRYPSARLLVLCAAAVVAVLAAAAGAQSAPGRRLDSPQLSQIARASGPIPDSELSRQGISRLVPGAYWGGVYRTASGESVTVYASTAYPQDPALGQKWADFLSTLVHRSDAPWSALDYGTKRWASYIQVCAKARQGQLFPGAEEAPRYQLNPGEGFAPALGRDAAGARRLHVLHPAGARGRRTCLLTDDDDLRAAEPPDPCQCGQRQRGLPPDGRKAVVAGS